MIGKTTADVRADVLAALAASSAVLALVPVERHYDGRIEAVGAAQMPALAVYVTSETEDWIGSQFSPMVRVQSEVTVVYYVTGTSSSGLASAVDSSLPIGAAIAAKLTAGVGYERVGSIRREMELVDVSTTAGAQKLAASVRTVVRLQHVRTYGAEDT